MTIGKHPASLPGKHLVVIGGTSGLGLSAARAFVNAGARVVAIGRDDENILLARKLLGESACVFAADATKPEAAEQAICECISTFGGFDGLYHVAGGSGRQYGDGPLHELTDEGWQATFSLNLTALFYSNRAAVRHLLARKTGGSVLNMGSVLGWSPSPHFFTTHAYATAKAAVIGLTTAAAAKYAPEGIRFNVLAPGLIATPMSQRAQQNPDIMQFIRTKQPLDGGRIGQPDDLDGAAVFFMSESSRFITGQVLAVDGGWSVSEGQFSPA